MVRRFILMLLLTCACAGVASAHEDTAGENAVSRLNLPDSFPMPTAVHIFPDTVSFGGQALVAVDFPVGTELPPISDLSLTGDGVVLVPADRIVPPEGAFPPTSDTRLLLSVRSYVLGDFQVGAGDFLTPPVMVRGRVQDPAETAPVRGPQLRWRVEGPARQYRWRPIQSRKNPPAQGSTTVRRVPARRHLSPGRARWDAPSRPRHPWSCLHRSTAPCPARRQRLSPHGFVRSSSPSHPLRLRLPRVSAPGIGPPARGPSASRSAAVLHGLSDSARTRPPDQFRPQSPQSAVSASHTTHTRPVRPRGDMRQFTPFVNRFPTWTETDPPVSIDNMRQCHEQREA